MKAGTSHKRKGSNDDEVSVKVLKGLPGDSVDPNLIIPGGRSARRGRPAIKTLQANYKAATVGDDSDDDSL